MIYMGEYEILKSIFLITIDSTNARYIILQGILYMMHNFMRPLACTTFKFIISITQSALKEIPRKHQACPN